MKSCIIIMCNKGPEIPRIYGKWTRQIYKQYTSKTSYYNVTKLYETSELVKDNVNQRNVELGYHLTGRSLPKKDYHLSITTYLLPLIYYHLSITTYLLPLIYYHLSITTYLLPLIYYHLSITTDLLPLIYYH